MKEVTGEIALAKRKELGLNQQQFWNKINVTQSGGSRYESSRDIPYHIQVVYNLVFGNDKTLRSCSKTFVVSNYAHPIRQ